MIEKVNPKEGRKRENRERIMGGISRNRVTKW